MNNVRLLNIIVFLMTSFLSLNAQTLHTVMMCNMEDRTLAKANEGEVKETKALMPVLASALGYNNNMIIHSGAEYTSTMMKQELDNLNVLDNDIVIFYYSSHGANWSDSEWPHMAFNDRQYGELMLYNLMRQKFSQAKLILCIAACCNMDAEGQARQRRKYGNIDPQLVKELFTGFEGHRSYIASSSIRGQYSWAWVGGTRPGDIYGIALRDAIVAACKGELRADWDYVFESTKLKTLSYSDQKQMPQYQKNRW